MEIIALILLTFLLVLYTVLIMLDGKPKSLSAGWYDTFQETLFGQMYFSITFFMIGILFMIAGFDLLPNDANILIFLSGAGVSLIGASPLYAENHVKRVHFGGALVAALASQTWAILYGSHLISIFIWILFGIIALANRKQRVLWLELACFINMIIQVAYKLIYI